VVNEAVCDIRCLNIASVDATYNLKSTYLASVVRNCPSQDMFRDRYPDLLPTGRSYNFHFSYHSLMICVSITLNSNPSPVLSLSFIVEESLLIFFTAVSQRNKTEMICAPGLSKSDGSKSSKN
jgi:hypothetical protein